MSKNKKTKVWAYILVKRGKHWWNDPSVYDYKEVELLGVSEGSNDNWYLIKCTNGEVSRVGEVYTKTKIIR